MADAAPNDILVLLATFPDADKGAEVARILVEEQLVACVSLVPQIRSIYRWQGAVEDSAEALAIMKTTRARYDALAARFAQLHPYSVPELLALPLAAGHAPYLAWVRESVGE